MREDELDEGFDVVALDPDKLLCIERSLHEVSFGGQYND
jgi:hypothetical protein